MVSSEQVEQAIKAQIPDAQVQVITPDGEHYEVTVVSSQFEGKGLVQQHQLVYRAIQQEMLSGAIHAMAVKTYTPQAWQAIS
ncbi:MAG: BolA family transcriptional regulator [Leptolyngbyaceae cyanobacterium]|jgi:acid stress-induced BolA-like protein IbaG/YrbA|uniref:BolA family protein n=1 Tax=Leptodesmis TaxID=2664261 RepID=UPI001F33B937|nr:BolA/IbaG family iron-sulfur metabolism protein [Leptodesmis sichuanensis]UIE37785.1 BolA/IbaG family iron-sulfur metabolism protein [Leptodesmis sichuanensis A121]